MNKLNLSVAAVFLVSSIASCTTKNNSFSDAPGLKNGGNVLNAAGGPQATGSVTPTPTLSEQARSAPADGAPTVAPTEKSE